MNILILGGTGSIGKEVVNQLSASKENHIFVTSRKHHESVNHVVYLQGNAHDTTFLRDIFEKRKYDSIIDFMSYSTKEFSERAEFLLKNTDHYYFLSSARVYAEQSTPLTEDSPRILDVSTDQKYLLTDEYALAKARQENILQKSHLRNWTIVRPYKTYNSNRLQLGMYEKEQWLFRILMGKTIAFPYDMKDKLTTLTYAGDVAKGIVALHDRGGGKEDIFQITESHPVSWESVISIYSKCIQMKTGITTKVVYSKNMNSFYKNWNRYQIMYDCMYDRVFDCSKIMKVCPDLSFVKPGNGLENCLNEFLSDPVFSYKDWKFNQWMNKMTGDNLKLNEVKGFKEKLRFIKAKS